MALDSNAPEGQQLVLDELQPRTRGVTVVVPSLVVRLALPHLVLCCGDFTQFARRVRVPDQTFVWVRDEARKEHGLARLARNTGVIRTRK